VKPQLTKLVDQAPEEPEWLHELKFDGYRMHARLDRGGP
jgi:ATP-dependent DNA ligase